MHINGIVVFVGKYFKYGFNRTFHRVFVAHRIARGIRYATSVVFIVFRIAFCISVVRQSIPYQSVENIRILTDGTLIIRIRRIDIIFGLIGIVLALRSEIYFRSDFQIVLKGI